jgi:hypothetical protein
MLTDVMSTKVRHQKSRDIALFFKIQSRSRRSLFGLHCRDGALFPWHIPTVSHQHADRDAAALQWPPGPERPDL